MTSKHPIDVTGETHYGRDMGRKSFTLRLDHPEREALGNLSKLERRPMNQLLNEAVKAYLARRGRKERDLEETPARLRAYRRSDPGFKRAIEAFVEAEATLEDPVEGSVIEEGPARRSGSAQGRTRQLLDA